MISILLFLLGIGCLGIAVHYARKIPKPSAKILPWRPKK